MILPALLAYSHYISFLLVISSLVAEAFLIAPTLTRREMRLLQRADAIYGIAAILVLITGFLRIYNFGKGPDYYFGNVIFMTKLSLFLIVGLLSIYPTIVFLRWRKLGDEHSGINFGQMQYMKIRRFIFLEVILLFTMPLLAALMARGIG